MTPTDIVEQVDKTKEAVAAQLQEPVREMAQQMLEWARAGADFAKEQAPLLAQEIVLRGMLKSLITMVAFIILTIVAIKATHYFMAWKQELGDKWDYDDDTSVPIVFGLVFGLGGAAFGTIFTLTNLYWTLAIWLAPRLYIIEELGRIVKGAQ